MKLLYPEFLWGLLAIIIPIIIHLFNFKKFKREYFSNINLLKEVKLETKNKSKLKHILVLLTRIVAIVLLVLAFCQPYFENGADVVKIDNTVAIYIDNSLSMDAKKEESYLLNEAKEAALDIVSSYSPTDKFLLLTNDFKGKHQRLVNKEEIEQLIDEVEISPINKTLSEVYERQKDLLKSQQNNKELFWVSDFSSNNFDLNNEEVDSSLVVSFIQLEQENKENIYIDSVWFKTPLRTINKEEQLFVRLVNKSENELGVKLNLKINDEIKSILNEQIEGQSTKEVQLNYTIQDKGEQYGEVYLSDYPNPSLTFDDSFLFSYKIKEVSKVLHLYEGSLSNFNPIETVFKDDDNYDVTVKNSSELDNSSLPNYDLLIVENLVNITNGARIEFKKYIENEGSVLMIPNESINLSSYNEFFSLLGIGKLLPKESRAVKINSIAKDDQFFNGVFESVKGKVDLPIISGYYPTSYKTRVESKDLMRLENGVNYFSSIKTKGGNFYFLSSSIRNSSFVEHAIFVPTILKVAENSQLSYPLYYSLGERGLLNVPNDVKEGAVIIKEKNEGLSFMPEYIQLNNRVQLDVHDNILMANHYVLSSEEKTVLPLSYNYDRKESDMTFYSKEDLESAISKFDNPSVFKVYSGESDAENSLQQIITKVKYWKYFIIGALLFFLLEVLIIRFFKL